MASVTASEQLMLELINLARLDPVGEAQRLGIDLNAGLPAGTITADPKQPLAFNDLLVTAARNHSVWQIDNDVFSHTGVGGSSPGDRMAAAGYVFTGLWSWGENIAWRGVVPGPIDAAAAILLQHDALFLSPGHRTNLLNDDMREIGVGQAAGSFIRDGRDWSASIVTQDFAVSGSQLFLTGVLYQDSNGDSRYGLGEGLGNWEVRLAHAGIQTAVQTNPYGGYESAIGIGANRISFLGAASVVVDVQITDQNIKLDLVGTTIRSSTSLTLINGATGAELLGTASTAIEGSASPERLVGNSGNNRLAGGGGADTLDGQAGADSLAGGEGNDMIAGGSGFDTAMFAAPRSAYTILLAPDGRAAVAYEPHGGDGVDVLTGIEQTNFAGVISTLAPTSSVLEYTASYQDLMNAFATNQTAAFTHFVYYGYAEGRSVTFSALEYIASYLDLMAAFGTNREIGAWHYIEYGSAEGRSQGSFDGLEYIASNPDLLVAFGADRDLGATHYINYGRHEGRGPGTFDGLEYIASNPDLIFAFGADRDAGSAHYINFGYAEGRSPGEFDGLQYIASHADLVQAFGTNSDAGCTHYIDYGYYEGRDTDDFDAAQYLANYADLQAAFGADLDAATSHYVSYGFYEGRVDDVLA